MGRQGIYKCNQCGNEFEAQEGGGFYFVEYRCVDCDYIKSINWDQTVPADQYCEPPKEKIGVCKKCGGELKDGLNPMCPNCKSRDVQVDEEKISVLYD
ncbi:MAG: hypothetical protein ABII18_13785 [bacterium]|nr:hypothetical protein [bacterium]MBU1917956.1 hypothetical protein [bacterium]